MIDKRRYTELELRVVDRLEDELYALGDPIIIDSEWEQDMFTKISNSIGIEADEVEAIHEKWQFDKVRDSMMETDRAFKEKTSEKS
tara:strand:+ start:261 stop:518 length:258 start_codon:yes stop_codon:yes gene_type:complete